MYLYKKDFLKVLIFSEGVNKGRECISSISICGLKAQAQNDNLYLEMLQRI